MLVARQHGMEPWGTTCLSNRKRRCTGTGGDKLTTVTRWNCERLSEGLSETLAICWDWCLLGELKSVQRTWLGTKRQGGCGGSIAGKKGILQSDSGARNYEQPGRICAESAPVYSRHPPNPNPLGPRPRKRPTDSTAGHPG